MSSAVKRELGSAMGMSSRLSCPPSSSRPARQRCGRGALCASRPCAARSDTELRSPDTPGCERSRDGVRGACSPEKELREGTAGGWHDRKGIGFSAA